MKKLLLSTQIKKYVFDWRVVEEALNQLIKVVLIYEYTGEHTTGYWILCAQTKWINCWDGVWTIGLDCVCVIKW
jgi:hypothetical protein